jgi:ankyrin repeat protein
MAASLGDLEVVRFAVEKAAVLDGIVDQKDSNGLPILHYFAGRLDSESNSNLRDILQCLLSAGIDPLAEDRGGRNAAHYACTLDHVHTAKVLLDVLRKRTADYINATTGPESESRTCLHIAALFGVTEIITWLLHNGAETGIEDSMTH